ncbi:putative Protein required for fusion of vesicles in vesicular transport [Paratrimastix pyriformis]|uniref:Uncharacterized protein n=1 Tax=Paratrimastix pyriformis TaxID=342808 RepID=A0ABQ8UVU6_9EUKA|nr:putative Protein required for fusion of vesicles in vesicular transport [Paratrimastix pyriformis]
MCEIGEAEELERSANKKVSGLFKKWDEGGEMFQRAANHFKVEQLFSDAARCFEKAADAFSHSKNRQSEIPRMWYEASNAYRKDSLSDAERCLKRAIDFHLSEGNPKAAARFLRDAGRIAQEAGDPASALVHFERAGQLAQGEEQNALTLECREQHAVLVSSHLKDYAQAAQIFEELAQLAVTNALTEGLVRRHLLRAGCCLLCNKDPVAVHAAMERYTSIYDKYSRTREYDLVNSCLEAIERADPTILATAVLLYDRVTPNRDPWLTEMLLQFQPPTLYRLAGKNCLSFFFDEMAHVFIENRTTQSLVHPDFRCLRGKFVSTTREQVPPASTVKVAIIQDEGQGIEANFRFEVGHETGEIVTFSIGSSAYTVVPPPKYVIDLPPDAAHPSHQSRMTFVLRSLRSATTMGEDDVEQPREKAPPPVPAQSPDMPVLGPDEKKGCMRGLPDITGGARQTSEMGGTTGLSNEDDVKALEEREKFAQHPGIA